MEYFIKDERSLPFIILNKNNKHTYFRIRQDHLEVSKAKRLSKKDVLKVIELNFDKFYSKYIKQLKSILPNNKIILENKEYEIINTNDNAKDLRIVNNEIFINDNFKNIKQKKYYIYESHLKKMLKIIKPKIKLALINNNIKERPIRFGYFKSKYGSYHRIKDEITLNVILAKLDINYLYYVLMHEYAHTLVFNHSNKFYVELTNLMPNYRKYDKKLKQIAIYL